MGGVRVIRLSRLARGRVGLLLAGLLITLGLGLGFGAHIALIGAGVLLAGFFLVLYDVDEETRR